jgi:hypothetical protein
MYRYAWCAGRMANERNSDPGDVKMLRNLTRDDMHILAVFTGWLVAFVLLVFVMIETKIGYQLFVDIMNEKETRDLILIIAGTLIMASIWSGFAVTDPKRGEGSVVFGVVLTAFNTAWLAIFYAHYMAQVVPPLLLLAYLVIPFYVIWVAQQTSGVIWAMLHAAPTVVAMWLTLDTRILFGLSGTFLPILGIVYALPIHWVEKAPVDRSRRALGLVLFVQGAALAVAFARLYAWESEKLAEK